MERPSQQRITEIKEETDDGFPLAKTICLGILLALLLLILFPSQPSMPPQMIVQTPALTPAMPLAPPSYTFTPETTSPPTTTPAPNFETGLMFTSTGKRSLGYTLRGVTTYVKIETYSGLKNYLTGLPRTYQCSITSLGSQPVCPSERELELRYLDQSAQKRYLEELSEKLKLQAGTKNDQARVAISLVQKIHYDEEGVRTNQLNNRYPYEVVYDNAGVCGEKSRLLAFLLRDIGFNVVLFSYEPENHMAVGIKCPMRYSYKNTGYCFIETAKPTIITNDQETYVGVGNLYSTPEIIPISDGISFDDVSEEYNDAREWIRINKLGDSSGGRLDRSTYNKWTSLVNKYGIEVSGEGR